jgi:tripartite-type tricarboxylate transporter receptor subunit TctC
MQTLRMIALAVAVFSSNATAYAQTYPSRPVRLLVGFAPGGGTDVVARLLARKLSESLGQPFDDGHTLLMGHVNSNAIAPSLMAKPPYDPVRDFATVAYVGFAPNVLTVNADFPAKTVAELVELSKRRDNPITFASPGIGSTNQLAGEILRVASGGKYQHIPYRGSSPAIVDLLAGRVDMNFDALSSVTSYLKSGHMRVLAVTTPQRDPALPDVPTMSELGYKTLDITNWYGIVAPAGTPADIKTKLHDEIYRILKLLDVAPILDEIGVRRREMTVDEFAKFIGAENEKYREIGKITGVQMD